MDCSPATPTPMTRTLAGGTVPAAVMNMGKNFPQVLGRGQAGPVARHRGLRAQGVHSLRPADAGEQVEAEHGGSPGGQDPQRSGRLGWLEETEHRRTPGDQRGTLFARCVDPDHQAGPLVNGGGVGGDDRSGRHVGGVAEGGLAARTGLDRDVPTRGHQLLDHLGNEGHPPLSGSGLGGDGQFHAGRV